MKKLLLIAMAFCFSQTCLRAQDVIILKTGDEIKSKVSEIGTTEIKYKKFDNLNGPVISILKSDVFMIKYENGTKDVFSNKNQSSENKPGANNQKAFNALIYAGASFPLGDFGESYIGAAKTGFTFGTEGNVNLSNSSIFFNYNLNYTYHPFKFSYNLGYPYNYSFSGNYNLIFGMVGFRFQGNTQPSKFYASFDGGVNHTWFGGVGNSESGTGFTFSVGTGAIVKNQLNIGIKYFNGRPSNSGETISITPLQFIVGIEF